MILTGPTPPTTPPTTPPAKLDPAALATQFTSIMDDLVKSDETLTSMATNANPVGTGWGPYLGGIAERIQTARDGFISLKPESAELTAALGKDVLKLAEASGSLTVMARQRATLSTGWSTFLDGAIADAKAAAAALTPVDPPATPPTTPPATPPTTPPATPPTKPAGPVLPASVAKDVDQAVQLVSRSIEWIRTVPVSDRGDASTKDARIAAYNLNMDAQKLLEGHFTGSDAALTSALRKADASLEDANWQLAKKPSPDGRFNGVDVPGALRDSQAAIDALTVLAHPTAVAGPRAAVAAAAAPAAPAHTGRLLDPVGQPGDIDYCQTPGILAGRH